MAGFPRWCNSSDWTVANQALTIRVVLKKVHNGAEKVQKVSENPSQVHRDGELE